MRGKLAEHLNGFIDGVNQAIAQAKADGVIPNPELAREKLNSLSAFVTKVPDIAYANRTELNKGEQKIPVKIFSPNPTKDLPVILFFHGGGHMCGDTELYDPMCRKIAINSSSVVISVDYRLSPENPYPAGLDDAELVVKHYQSIMTGVQFDKSRLYIAGDSAGGAICTSLTMRKHKDPDLRFTKQILIYPSVDYTMSSPSYNDNGVGFFLEKARVQWYFDNYFLNDEDRKACSPLFAPIDSDSPETLIIIAGCDPLRDEGLLYADKLKEQGIRVETKEFANMIHAFMNIEDLVPEECSELFTTIGGFVNS